MTGHNVVTHHSAQINGIRIRYGMGGKGPPLVLLHGFPQSSRTWRHVIPALTADYTVIAPDLRGFGDSDRPASGYDKRTVAQDVYELVQQLGFDEINLVGHDVGMLVAYEYAARHPGEVRRLAVLDSVLPGFGLDAVMDVSKFPHVWHVPFFSIPDVAETLIVGREREFFTDFTRKFSYDPNAVDDADIAYYVDRLKAPGGLRSAFAHYRTFPQDRASNEENSRIKLSMPVLAIGGEFSLGEMVGQAMQQLAENVTPIVVKSSGHWIPEEQPVQLIDILRPFLK
ncbi:alpha/beta hydrolase [Rhizobium sp. NZLR3b]|uniref:alpha/beta fold hydrolase n=1 Tax=Rhizobium sp. NZLR3b TaxID=2731101 RepID=UPI001C838751|nr:alpha/beta hydrolase [Rhizobium sp. NZLR3b]MBX5193705.1 alpha/beta hydrolase [Rhizobium sp. NZLR3b]